MRFLSVLFLAALILSPDNDCYLYRTRGNVQIKKSTSQDKQIVHEGMNLSLDDSIFVNCNSAVDIVYQKSVISIGQCATTVKKIVSSNKDRSLFRKMWEYLNGNTEVYREYAGHKGEADYNVAFSINNQKDKAEVKAGEVFFVDVVNNEDQPVCVALLWQNSINKKETVGAAPLSIDSPTDMPLCEIIPPQSSVRYYLKISENTQPGIEKAILVIEMDELFDPISCLTSDKRTVKLNCKREIELIIQ